MRTTITIENDALTMARESAEASGDDLGTVVSDVAKSALQKPEPKLSLEWDDVLGIYILPRTNRKTPLTLEEVNRIRDEDE